MLKKPTEDKHPKESALLAHTTYTSSHPVWLSLCDGPENLSGSSTGSTQLPGGLLPSSLHRGRLSGYWFISICFFLTRDLNFMKLHPFPQANELLYRRNNPKSHLWLQPMRCLCLSENNVSSFLSFEVAGKTCRLWHVTTQPLLPLEAATTSTKPFQRLRSKRHGEEWAWVHFVLPHWSKSWFFSAEVSSPDPDVH